MSNVGPLSAHRDRKCLKRSLESSKKKIRELSLTFYLSFLSHAFFFIIIIILLCLMRFFVLRFETLNHKVTKS